jgi:quercetin dioxygenase-like cupin family protein
MEITMTVQLFTHPSEAETIHVLGSAMALLATADQTDEAYEAVLVDTGPGGDLVPHRHPWEELYLVLEGTMEVQVGRRVRPAGPGSFVTLPARCLHAFRVTSEHARFLHVSLGRGAVDAFRDLAAEVPPEPTLDDAEAVLAVLARHGIEVVLPELDATWDGAA